MCIAVLVVELGPADACIDTDRRELYLAPRTSREQRTTLARALLQATGIDQPGHDVTCVCGARIDMPDADRQAAG